MSEFLPTFTAKRGGIQYPLNERVSAMPEPTEGFIDVRFVIGSPDDEDAPNSLYRIERMGYLLPEGTSSDSLRRLNDYFWEYPHELVADVAGIFQHIPAPTRTETL